MSDNSSGTSLSKGKLGTAGIVFFVVAAAAPLLGMTGAVPVAMFLGNGAGASGTYLAVGLLLALFAVGYSAMSQKVTNTGAFFAYVGRGLGRNAGVASAFASIVGYVTIQLAIYGFFGGVMSFMVPGLPWYGWALVAWAVATLLSLFSVDIGSKVLGVLMILEVLALVVTAVAILVQNAGSIDFVAAFSPDAILAGGVTGTAGIAIAFAFASFIGFEATAIYGEESKDPKRSVAKATYWAIGLITGLFAVVSLAMSTAMASYSNPAGPEGLQEGLYGYIAEFGALDPAIGLTNPAGVLQHMADVSLGGTWMSTIMGYLVLTSCFAGILAFQNAISRYFFAMGRGGVLPAAFGKTNGSGAPQNGVILTSVLALVIMLGFAAAGLDGIGNLFTWMSAITAVAIMFVEVLVSIAIMVYLRKDGTFNVWKSTIAPLLSAVGLAFGLYLLMSRFNLLGNLAAEGVDPTAAGSAWMLSPMGWAFVLSPFIAAVIGFVVAAATKSKRDLAADILS
jgi:amino acid transporter